jgi:hypothetical protein
MPKPMAKRQKLAPGQERSITVTLESLRNPPLDIKLTSQTPNTSVLDLKSKVSEKAGVAVEKLKLLYKKKPVVDSKVLKDLVSEDEVEAEFSIMVMGGAASLQKAPEAKDVEMGGTAIPAAQGPSGEEVLKSDEFWNDLQGFLTQRLRDEAQGQKVFGIFKSAWESNERK